MSRPRMVQLARNFVRKAYELPVVGTTARRTVHFLMDRGLYRYVQRAEGGAAVDRFEALYQSWHQHLPAFLNAVQSGARLVTSCVRYSVRAMALSAKATN